MQSLVGRGDSPAELLSLLSGVQIVRLCAHSGEFGFAQLHTLIVVAASKVVTMVTHRVYRGLQAVLTHHIHARLVLWSRFILQKREELWGG